MRSKLRWTNVRNIPQSHALKQGLNEADHRFLTFFAVDTFRLGNAQSELKGGKFQRASIFVFGGAELLFFGLVGEP
jgi:hypothetical protein